MILLECRQTQTPMCFLTRLAWRSQDKCSNRVSRAHTQDGTSEIRDRNGRRPVPLFEFLRPRAFFTHFGGWKKKKKTKAKKKKPNDWSLSLISKSQIQMGWFFSACSRGSGTASRHRWHRGARAPLVTNPSRGSAGGASAPPLPHPQRSHLGFGFFLNRAPLLYRAPIRELGDTQRF